jgi:NAD(P)-dependent dehydrogenase (short-subunit alcohol dehydrogenase family)
MNTLANKTALITGASSGIGYATALLFAREGAKVVLGARRQTELNQLVAAISAEGGTAVCLAGDVCDADYARQLVELAVQRFGGLDIAFNNAGTLGALGPSLDISATAWRDTIETNLNSAFFAAQYQLEAMQKRGGGSLIFTSSFVGYTVGFPGMAAYAASKAGLIGLTQALAVEFGAQAIRVNALLPGGTDTPMGAVITNTAEAKAHVASLHVLKRIAAPEEIARAALFLASDAASFVTGSAMLADGGVSVSRN